MTRRKTCEKRHVKYRSVIQGRAGCGGGFWEGTSGRQRDSERELGRHGRIIATIRLHWFIVNHQREKKKVEWLIKGFLCSSEPNRLHLKAFQKNRHQISNPHNAKHNPISTLSPLNPYNPYPHKPLQQFFWESTGVIFYKYFFPWTGIGTYLGLKSNSPPEWHSLSVCA